MILSRVNNRAGLRALATLKERVDRKNYISLAFYSGFQYLYWDLRAGRLKATQLPEHVQYEMVNLVQPFVQRAVSQILLSPPRFYVAPGSSDPEDRAAARVAEKILSSLWEELDLGRKVEELVRWFVVTGNAFLKVAFDPTAGDPIRIYYDPATKEPIPDLMLNGAAKAALAQQKSFIEVRQGQIRVDVPSPFEVYVPSYVSSLDRSVCPWIVQAYRRTRQHLGERYQIDPDELVREAISVSEPEDWESRILGLASGHLGPRRGPTYAPQTSVMDDDETLVVREYHEPPGTKFAKGLHAVVAGGRVLSSGECPFNEFIDFHYIPRPGNFWSIGVAENLITLQRRLNRVRSQMTEHANLVLKPKLLVPRGAELESNSYNDQPGEKLKYSPTGGAKPEYLQPPDLPRGFEAIEDRVIASMREVASIHEVTTARAPENVRTGVALALLQEQDRGFFTTIVRQLETGLAKTGRRILEIARDHFPEERMVRAVGKNRQVEALYFRGADLTGATDVRVEVGSALPYSRAARQQFALDMLQFGAWDMTNPRDKARFFEVLELGDTQKWQEQTEQDEVNQEQEIDRMIAGEIIPPEDFDDHEVHLGVVNAFRKSESYRRLDAEAQARIDVHADGHAIALAAQMAQALQAQQALNPEPNGKGGGGGGKGGGGGLALKAPPSRTGGLNGPDRNPQRPG